MTVAEPPVKIVSREVVEERAPTIPVPEERDVLFAVRDLTVTYDGVPAFRDVTLDIRQNFVTAVRLREEHVHPLLQPHERLDPLRARRGDGPLPRP